MNIREMTELTRVVRAVWGRDADAAGVDIDPHRDRVQVGWGEGMLLLIWFNEDYGSKNEHGWRCYVASRPAARGSTEATYLGPFPARLDAIRAVGALATATGGGNE